MHKKMMSIMLVMVVLVLGGLYFAWQGVSMHLQVPIEETKFHALQESYFIQSKAVRDSAPTGSELNQDLVQIANYPSMLLELKLVGIGNILTGIFLLLLGILIALIVMPMRISVLMRRQRDQM